MCFFPSSKRRKPIRAQTAHAIDFQNKLHTKPAWIHLESGQHSIRPHTYRWRPFCFIRFSLIFFPLSISTSIICLTKWLCSNAGHSKATEVRFARIHRHSSPSQTVTTVKGHLVFLPRQPGASPTVLYDHINPFKGLCPICIAVDEMRGWEPASPEEPDKRGEKAAHSNRLPVLHH